LREQSDSNGASMGTDNTGVASRDASDTNGAQLVEPLAMLAGALVERAAQLMSPEWDHREAARRALDELDFNDPALLGPLVVSVVGLEGGRLEIEQRLRSMLLELVLGSTRTASPYLSPTLLTSPNCRRRPVDCG
jgi:hypothetical protein